MHPVVKMRAVKQLLCVLLALWFGVMSNWAQAHATHEAAHEITHILNDDALDTAPDADQDEHCGLAHCCHPTAVLRGAPAYSHLKVCSQQPTIEARLTPRLPPSEIERPKWALATHVVASF